MLQPRSLDKLPAKNACTSPRYEEKAIQPEESMLLMAPREAWLAGRSHLGQKFYWRHGESANQIVIKWYMCEKVANSDSSCW